MASQDHFYSVQLTTPLGEIRGKVAVQDAPMRLAELVPTALDLTNILVQRAIKKEEALGRQISCGPGCGMCCRQMVPVSPPEAFYIMDLLDFMAPNTRAELMARFNAIEKVLQKRGMITPLMSPEYTDEPVLAVAKQYYTLNLECPFLTNESCSIYRYRPVVCREYNVTSPPEHCKNPYTLEVEKVSIPLALSAVLSRLTARLTHTKPRLIPLSLVPYWVSKVGELRWRQWPGVELFQTFMSFVGPSSHEQGVAA
ncbi:MAG: hypothetical protein DRG63_11900 [Deltaproteobacteria bacterium]|nr:MAG: hypothetical protein DRG63_11900 [Deltaproteobacteria bacterium]